MASKQTTINKCSQAIKNAEKKQQELSKQNNNSYENIYTHNNL